MGTHNTRSVADGPQTQMARGSKGVAIIFSAQAALGWEKAGTAVYGGYGGRVLGLSTMVVDKQKKERGLLSFSLRSGRSGTTGGMGSILL